MGQSSSTKKPRRKFTNASQHQIVIQTEDSDTKALTVLHKPPNIHDLSSEIQLLGDVPIAYGVISSIWLGKIWGGRRVAVKRFVPNRPESAIKQDFLREANVWSRAMRHENIMPLLGVARVRDTVALVSPWMPEGTLKDYLNGHPEANITEIMADVARGMAYLHSQGIVYCNLRSSTVLVSDMGRAYLSSFLAAQTQNEIEMHEIDILDWRNSSPEFISPGSFPMAVDSIEQTCESDVFTFGTTVMEAFTFDSPNSLHRDNVVMRSLLQGRPPERPQYLEDRGFTDDLWLLVNKCWRQDPKERPTMGEVAQEMVRFAEASISIGTNKHAVLPRRLKNISPEIKKLSEHPIAGGGYCDLYLGERLGYERVALKLVRLFGSADLDKDAARRRFMSEARIWAQLQHPRILEFYGICEYGTMSLFMVSPFLQNSNILHFLSKVNPDADRRRLLLETAEGLIYLHTRNPPVIHGDLKGVNILISDTGNALLADFGLSRISHEATTTMLHGAGSPRWMAPELILAGNEESGPLKTRKSDVYAYGQIMLEVLGDKKPFYHLKEDLHVIVELIHGRRSPRPTGYIADTWLNDSTWAYYQKCTAVNPDERPEMEIVLIELRDSVFT